MKRLVVFAIIAAIAIAVTAIPIASATSTTVIRTKTVAVANSRLVPGTRLTFPATYHHQRVTRFQWLRCNVAGARCKAIAHATHRSYVVRRADVGHTLRARATTQASTIALSAPTALVGRPAPVNTAIPVITDGGQGGGTVSGPIAGDVLTGSNGTWQHAIRFTYQWEDCDTSGANCVAIAGATTNTYTLQDPSDVGHTVVFQVTGYNF